MLDKILSFIANKFSEAPIVVTKGNINMPANAWTELATISLKAKRRYMVFARTGSGNSASAVSNANITLKSGTAHVSVEMAQGAMQASSGHSIMSAYYIETNTACTLAVRKYNYSNTDYPGGNAAVVAIPVLSGGGTVKVGISMLSTIERWWKHVRQNTGIHCTKIADTDRRGNNECIKLPVLQTRKNRYMRFEIPVAVESDIRMGLCRNITTRIQTANGHTGSVSLGQLCICKWVNSNQDKWQSKRVRKLEANISPILDCLRLFSKLGVERGCASC